MTFGRMTGVFLCDTAITRGGADTEIRVSTEILLPPRSSHTPSIAFRHLPPRKDVVNQCLEFAFEHGSASNGQSGGLDESCGLQVLHVASQLFLQHRRLTLEKKCLLPVMEPGPLQARVRPTSTELCPATRVLVSTGQSTQVNSNSKTFKKVNIVLNVH